MTPTGSNEAVARAIEGARLVYLYMGSANVPEDLRFYEEQLGGEVAWRSRAFGTEVAAVRLGDGPLLLLADHRQAPSVRQIWSVPDLAAAVESLTASGWAGPRRQVEVPDGPCLLLEDPSGNEVGLLEQSRPGIMERR
jgi:predicted enzyme related to lactoylglutathione lyase